MSLKTTEALWMTVGFAGQFIFMARFLVQWAASEKKREPVVPLAFWWISLFGGLTLLCYAIHKSDPPFILGQGMGLFVYIRNLMLASKARRRAARRLAKTRVWLSHDSIPASHLAPATKKMRPER
jgi:lipid-A-disaccharide synthase-like uncharacterized protein